MRVGFVSRIYNRFEKEAFERVALFLFSETFCLWSQSENTRCCYSDSEKYKMSPSPFSVACIPFIFLYYNGYMNLVFSLKELAEVEPLIERSDCVPV